MQALFLLLACGYWEQATAGPEEGAACCRKWTLCCCIHRKKVKLQGQFKGLVKAAQRGTQKGHKLRRKSRRP